MLKLKIILHKLFHWEYWPVWIIYLPCFIIYPFYAIRSRSMLFFTAVNPGIVNGGAFLVPKDEIYNKFPDSIVPKTLVVNTSFQKTDIIDWMKAEQVSFPLLLKPNHGLRGIGLSLSLIHI